MSLEIKQEQLSPQNKPLPYLGQRFAIIKKALPGFLRNEHFLAALLLLAILLIFYRDVAFGGRTFLAENGGYGTMPAGPYSYPAALPPVNTQLEDVGAISLVNEPYNRWAGSVIRQGELPLWNWHTGLGQPFLADGSSAALEPIQLAFFLLSDSWWTVTTDLQVLLRFFLAGFFTYLFVRQLGLSFVPAVFAGVAFMLSSFFVEYGNHTQLRPESLVPLLLYSYERLVRKSRIVVFSLCVLIVAWIIVAAMPEDGFLGLFLANSWYVYRGFWQSLHSKFDCRVIRRLLLNLVIASGLGVALSAFFLLPLVENINDSLHIHYNSGGAVFYPPIALVALLPNQTPPFFPAPHFYAITLILGLGGLLILSTLGRYRHLFLFFAAYFLIFSLKIYNFPLVQWIGSLPVIKQVSLIKYIIPHLNLCLGSIISIKRGSLQSVRVFPKLEAVI